MNVEMSSSDFDQVMHKALELERVAHKRRMRWLWGTIFVAVALPIAASLYTKRLVIEAEAAKNDAATAVGQRDTALADRKVALGELEKARSEMTQLKEDKKNVVAEKKETERRRDEAVNNLRLKKAEVETVDKELARKKEELETVKRASEEVTAKALTNSNVAIDWLKKRAGENKPITVAEIQEFLIQIEGTQKVLVKANELATLVAKQSLNSGEQQEAMKLAQELVPDTSLQNTAPSAKKGRVQFLLGGPAETLKQREAQLKDWENFVSGKNYEIESGRANAARSPDTVEVRYYHLPEDKPKAEALLKLLTEKDRTLRGRVSFVADSSQPRGNFQVALPAESASVEPVQGTRWGIQVGFGTNYSTKQFDDAKRRLKAVRTFDDEIPGIIYKNDREFSLIIGSYQDSQGADNLLRQAKAGGSELGRALRSTGRIGWILPPMRPVPLSESLGEVVYKEP